MIFVIGGRGRLGRSIAAEFAAQDPVLVAREIYQPWSQKGACDAIARYFEKQAAPCSTIFVASGLLDPRLPPDELLGVNFRLPRNIIEAAGGLGMKVITFGTVMEHLPGMRNHYIESKTALGSYVAGLSRAASPAAHLRLHTLYGVGEPSPFMFLGQMLDSIRRNAAFQMTVGTQLREYHHLEDEAKAIRTIAASNIAGTLTVSHGQPVSLGEIAHAVFSHLGREHLLHMGAVTQPPAENLSRVFVRPDVLRGIGFRDTLPAIVDYVKTLLPPRASCLASIRHE